MMSVRKVDIIAPKKKYSSPMTTAKTKEKCVPNNKKGSVSYQSTSTSVPSRPVSQGKTPVYSMSCATSCAKTRSCNSTKTKMATVKIKNDCCNNNDCEGCGDPCLGPPFPDEVLCDPEMVCRVIQLLTDPCIYVYYVLAALYISGYAVLSAPDGVSRKYHDAYWRKNGHAHDGAFKHSILRGLPLLYLLSYIVYSKACDCAYCKWVCVGLLLSSLAEALHVYNWDYFIHVVALYSIVMLCYIFAMYCKYRGTRLSWLMIVADVACMAVLHHMVAGYLSALVLFFFGFFIVAMAFFALARYEKERTGPAYLGAAGGLLFKASCFLYALGQFSPLINCVVSPELVMVTYYLAQLGIGLSVHTC